MIFSAGFTDGSKGVFVSNLVASLPQLPGDFNQDGDVDGRDFLLWQQSPSIGNLADWQANYPAANASVGGDFDGDGDVDGRDFLVWQRNPAIGNLADWQNNYGFGTLATTMTVPEPSALIIGLFTAAVFLRRCSSGFVIPAQCLSSRRGPPHVTCEG